LISLFIALGFALYSFYAHDETVESKPKKSRPFYSYIIDMASGRYLYNLYHGRSIDAEPEPEPVEYEIEQVEEEHFVRT